MSFLISGNSPPHSTHRHHTASSVISDRSSSSSKHHKSHHDDSHSHSHSEMKKAPQHYFVRAPSSSSKSAGHAYIASSSSSSGRARPRSGFVARILSRIRRILRRLYAYARRHPVKLFMMVIMPLITGGALADLLRRFGIRLPAGLEGMIPGSGKGRGGGGYGRAHGGVGAEGLAGVMSVAKMFM